MSRAFAALMPTHAALVSPVATKKRRGEPQAQLYTLSKNVLELVWLERLRQKQLFRDGHLDFECSSPIVDDFRKLAVLTEELGEVAKEILEVKKHTKANARVRLKMELTQLVAVGIAWLESLEEAE